MVRIELKEIVSNYDNKRKALNAVERGNKKTNPQYPYYGANGIVDFIDEYIFDEELLCIAEDGGNWGYKQNCSYIVNGKYWVNNHVHVLKPKKNVEIKYLMYYLNYTDLTSYITGTTRGKLTRTALDKIQINLPELEIQREIVIILDKINNLIEKNKKRIIYLEELVKSRFIEMFGDPIKNDKGWEVKKWEEVLKIINGKNQKKVENESGKYDIFGSGGKMGKADDWLVKENSVLIGRKGSINKPIIVKEKIWNVDTVFGLEPNIEIINCDYLYYFCYFYDFERLNKAVTIPSLTKKDLLKIDIPIPPLVLQEKFVLIHKSINKLKFRLFSSIILGKNLFKNLTLLIFLDNIRLVLELDKRNKNKKLNMGVKKDV